MGSGNSHHMQPPPGGPLLVDHHSLPALMQHEQNHQQQQMVQYQYPDMNQIFKGIPKMMQVADDMHRMTNYMQDLRNLMLVCCVISFIGLCCFMLVKYWHGRKSTKRRRRTHNANRTDESEQSSLSIGASRPNNPSYRHYHSARPADNWTHKIEMDRMLDSTSTRHTQLTHTPLIHGTGHGLLLNNKSALSSPEHHNYNLAMASGQSPMHEAASLGGQPQQQLISSSPAPTPTSSSHQPLIMAADNNTGGGRQHHAHAPNGQLKRLDPVKLVVDEMPAYMENHSNGEEEHQQQRRMD